MSDFHIRKDAQEWFRKIKKPLDEQDGNAGNMSMYYYCLMVGLAKGRRATNINSAQLASLINRFPRQLEAHTRLIIAVFLAVEIESQGLRLDVAKRDQIQNYIRQFITPMHPHLTPEGVKRLDSYAHGGFEVLQDELDPPETLEGFLMDYAELVKDM